jgi:hypothetical protein
MPGSNVLAVVVAPALLLLWDVAGEQHRAMHHGHVSSVVTAFALLARFGLH